MNYLLDFSLESSGGELDFRADIGVDFEDDSFDHEFGTEEIFTTVWTHINELQRITKNEYKGVTKYSKLPIWEEELADVGFEKLRKSNQWRIEEAISKVFEDVSDKDIRSYNNPF